jgi:glycosyltransferase involved in cell wall biosynthesis
MGVVDEEIQNADKIHIATEGAIGLAARHSCKKYKKKYITSFHTQYPDYLYEHAYIPPRITGRYFRWFHRNSSAVLVPTPAMVDYCKKYGIQKLKLWSRGVDTNLFKPDPNFKRQGEAIRAVYVGRVSVEKNLEEFLKINNPQIVKYIIGDGPQLEEYKAKYSDAFFLGKKTQQEIASILQTMDVFAWPSLTDTFGLVVLEAMASGLPVAAFRNEVNEFIITEKSGELMTWDLEEGILSAFKTLKKEDAIARAKEFSWETATQQFISHLV